MLAAVVRHIRVSTIPFRVDPISRAICNVRVKIEILSIEADSILINKPSNHRVVISGPVVVQAGFGIIFFARVFE